MRVLLLLALPLFLTAQSYLVSSIPLPKSFVQNLDPFPCDNQCLTRLVNEGQIFSFLAHAKDRLDDPELNEVLLIHTTLLNLGTVRQSNQLKIALLLPHRVIGRYALSTTNAVFAYMLAKNRAFELKSYQVESESPDQLADALRRIEEDGFYYVIAPVTRSGADAVVQSGSELTVYFPTVNRRDMNVSADNYYYGGIDYRAQIDTLLQEANASLVVFSDSSPLGEELETYTKEAYNALLYDVNYSVDGNDSDVNATAHLYYNVTRTEGNESVHEVRAKKVTAFTIDKHTSNLEKQLSGNDSLEYGNFFLNTPVVKSGMVLSQITLFDVNVSNILSTQISYDPLILSMTQFQDRKKMIVANSIDTNNNVMVETNALLSNDIVYDWINYATTIGADLFYHFVTRSEREYDLPIVENQVRYPIRLFRPSYSRFIEYFPPTSRGSAEEFIE